MAANDPRSTILAHLREAGCTCDPNILIEGEIRAGAATNVRIQHDDDCPLLRQAKASQN